MKKIKSLAQIAKITDRVKKIGKKVGLITGCFDVVHAGHVDLFRFAKKHCNLVVVGLDSDETITLSKGKNRPIHNILQRERVLSEFESVDLIFSVGGSINFGTKGAEKYYWEIADKIRPTYLITNPLADQFWKEKQKRAKMFGAKLLKDIRQKDTSTTEIAGKIAAEI